MYLIKSINTDKIRGTNQQLAGIISLPLLLKVLTIVKSPTLVIHSLAFWHKGDLLSLNMIVLNWNTTAKVLTFSLLWS